MGVYVWEWSEAERETEVLKGTKIVPQTQWVNEILIPLRCKVSVFPSIVPPPSSHPTFSGVQHSDSLNE